MHFSAHTLNIKIYIKIKTLAFAKVFIGWDSRTRTYAMMESESIALPTWLYPIADLLEYCSTNFPKSKDFFEKKSKKFKTIEIFVLIIYNMLYKSYDWSTYYGIHKRKTFILS